MAQSVSNDALWEKLSEMDKKLDELPVKQKSPIPTQEPPENKFDFERAKREIIVEIKKELGSLKRHCDDNFKTGSRDIGTLNENILKVFNVVEPQKGKESFFNFWFFKVRKTSFVIAILGLLVFILTLFCMKQQNDYSLLMNEYYRQGIEIREMQKREESVKGKR